MLLIFFYKLIINTNDNKMRKKTKTIKKQKTNRRKFNECKSTARKTIKPKHIMTGGNGGDKIAEINSMITTLGMVKRKRFLGLSKKIYDADEAEKQMTQQLRTMGNFTTDQYNQIIQQLESLIDIPIDKDNEHVNTNARMMVDYMTKHKDSLLTQAVTPPQSVGQNIQFTGNRQPRYQIQGYSEFSYSEIEKIIDILILMRLAIFGKDANILKTMLSDDTITRYGRGFCNILVVVITINLKTTFDVCTIYLRNHLDGGIKMLLSYIVRNSANSNQLIVKAELARLSDTKRDGKITPKLLYFYVYKTGRGNFNGKYVLCTSGKCYAEDEQVAPRYSLNFKQLFNFEGYPVKYCWIPEIGPHGRWLCPVFVETPGNILLAGGGKLFGTERDTSNPPSVVGNPPPPVGGIPPNGEYSRLNNGNPNNSNNPQNAYDKLSRKVSKEPLYQEVLQRANNTVYSGPITRNRSIYHEPYKPSGPNESHYTEPNNSGEAQYGGPPHSASTIYQEPVLVGNTSSELTGSEESGGVLTINDNAVKFDRSKSRKIEHNYEGSLTSKPKDVGYFHPDDFK